VNMAGAENTMHQPAIVAVVVIRLRSDPSPPRPLCYQYGRPCGAASPIPQEGESSKILALLFLLYVHMKGS